MPYTDKPQEILASIRPGSEPQRVYILTGAEEYFTDKIEKKIVSTYMNEEERDFNLTLLYGMHTTVGEIIASCRRVPMGSRYTIVVVREAQHLLKGSSNDDEEDEESKGSTGTSMNDLKGLLTNPVPSNILILEFKGKSPNRNQSFFKAVAKEGVYVDSKEVREYQLDSYIIPLARERGLQLDAAAMNEVAQHIGTDVMRLDSELEKLAMALTEEQRRHVTPQEVLKYTSLAKEFSAFDLKHALARKDYAQSLYIAQTLSRDEKKNPIQMIIPVLFNYFSNLLVAFYAPAPRDEQAVMQWLGLNTPYMARDYVSGLRSYRGRKVADIISALRRADARSKGMYSNEGSSEEILIDLVLMILN